MTGTFHPSEDCTCTVDETTCPLWVHTERSLTAADLSRLSVQANARNNGAASDPANHPPHYTSHPSGVECITVTEWFGFNVGNAIKYLWRAGEKGDPIQDLEKAR